MDKKYNISLICPVIFSEEISAKSLKEAREKAEEMVGEIIPIEDAPLPQDNYLVETSQLYTKDMELLAEFNEAGEVEMEKEDAEDKNEDACIKCGKSGSFLGSICGICAKERGL